VIAALQGAFAARSRRGSCSATDLLEVLHDTVASIRRRTLVLVLDPLLHMLTWASDGHRGAAILSDDGIVRLSIQDEATSGALPLPANALVVLMSTSVAAAAAVDRALGSGRAQGLRLPAQLVELAADADAQGGGSDRDLFAVGLVQSA
jgi:hypothetical protein